MKPTATLLVRTTIVLAALCFLGIPGLSHANWNSFKTVVYTGNGGTQQIAGLGFKPDLVWIKRMNSTGYHYIFDTVRGEGHYLSSDDVSNHNISPNLNSLSSFTSDGFDLGNESWVNGSGDSFVAWCWKAGDSIVSNTDGNITSTVSANTDSGFSIVKYAGSGATGSFGHGLGMAPSMVIIKCLNAASDWYVWHKDGNPSRNLRLNTDVGELETGNRIYDVSDTTVTLTGGIAALNQLGYSYVAYVWAEVPGASSIGSYTGNGSTTGPIIDCGFKPAYIMIKRTDAAGHWMLYDTKRDPDNPNTYTLWANLANAENPNNAYIDFLANGFQPVNASPETNASGGTYIYMAFAEHDVPDITFSSDKSSVDYSAQESATLSWDVSFADTVTIEPGLGTVDLAGTAAVTPTATTTYTITATVGQNSISDQVTVNVTNGFDQGGVFTVDGKIGVGVLTPQHALEVNGTIRAREVIVTTQGWADYVFDDNYRLRDLDAVEDYIQQHRHLPGIPSAARLEAKGLPVSDMLELQMKKIEELTLYIIELSKENKTLERRLNALE